MGSSSPPAKGGIGRAIGAGARVIDMLLAAAAIAALTAMTGVTVTDVIGRYLFNAPLRGADELTAITLAVTVFAGLPLGIARGGMIAVEVLMMRLPARLQRWLGAGTDLIAAGFLAYCAWQIGRKAARLAAYGEASMFLRIPMAPLAWAMAAGCALGALAFLAVAAMRFARRGESGVAP